MSRHQNQLKSRSSSFRLLTVLLTLTPLLIIHFPAPAPAPVSPRITCLNDAILELLGDDPTISTTYGTEIHKDLAVRLEHTATHGLSREARKEFSDTYLLPSNCKLIDAPALNAEMKAAISEMTAKRDKSIEFRQKQNATAISGLSQAINKMFSYKEADPTIIKMLMDAVRILCDLQHHDSTVRRSFILTSVKKDMKDQLQNTNLTRCYLAKILMKRLRQRKQ